MYRAQWLCVFSFLFMTPAASKCDAESLWCTEEKDGASLLQGHVFLRDMVSDVKGQSSRARDIHIKPAPARGPQNERQQKIVDMMTHAWKGYETHCFGQDELQPLDGTCRNTWGLGFTLIDSLDTLFLLGMNEQFQAARDWVANRTALNFDNVGGVSLFETTIRIMGGLLGAHALSQDRVFLDRAQDLGDRLLSAFAAHAPGPGQDSPPSTDVDLHLRRADPRRDPGLAEPTSLGLEFKTLATLTGHEKFATAVESVSKAIHKQPKFEGLALDQIDKSDGHLFGAYKLGSGGDSYYEYLLKQWLLTGRKEPDFLRDYQDAVKGIRHHLVKETRGPLHLTYVAELESDKKTINRKMDHLVCFLPGTLALGAHYGADSATGLDMKLAKKLAHTCYQMYNISGHMLGPEIAMFDTQGQELFVKDGDSHDLLRPETVESLFYLYRLTGDKQYQDWGWQIAQGIERWAKVENGGYASLDSVLDKQPIKRNHMESFFLAETLKYLFLLFDDSRTQVPLDKFVFNTEAHPLRIMTGTHPTKAEPRAMGEGVAGEGDNTAEPVAEAPARD